MKQATGGGRGIRTLETVTRLHAFQACAFDHSATPPKSALSSEARNILRSRRGARVLSAAAAAVPVSTASEVAVPSGFSAQALNGPRFRGSQM